MENTEDRNVRVADYLDDKLQTIGDLDSLDSLLSNLRNQHALLQQQLQDAGRDLEKAKGASYGHEASLQQRAAQFHREQADIDNKLRIIMRSETSDEAVVRFEASMDKLARLDVANAYVELIKEVDSLR
jgi:predicted  nucleic acid-binding Zn-ribbon protein